MKKHIVITILIAILLTTLAAAVIFTDNSAATFNQGTHNNTFFNGSGFVQLSPNTNGSFLSRVFSAGSTVQWTSLNWVESVPYKLEFPANQAVETVTNGANMSNNALLLHLNNASTLTDFSGNSNSGTAQGNIGNVSGIFDDAAVFNGENTIRVNGAASLNLSDEVTVEAWINPNGNQPAFGEIHPVLDTLEFDTATAQESSIVQVNDNIFAIAYRGPSDDGFVKTVTINDGGQIDNAVIDTLEFDTNTGREPHIVHINGNTFAIAYRGPGNDGFIKTVTINDAGAISNAVVDTLEFDTSDGRAPFIMHISSSIYAVFYQGPSSDGFVKTVTINDDGQIDNVVVDTLEFDTSTGREPSADHVSSNVYAVAYRGPSDDGFIKTVTISSNGNIGGVVDTLEFDTSTSITPQVIEANANTFAVSYRGPGSDGFVKTITIANNGQITSPVVDTLEFDTGTGITPFITKLTNNKFAVAYRGASNDGFLKTIEITNNGVITNNIIDTLEFDTSVATFPFLLPIQNNLFALTYRGPGNDGFLKTLKITSHKGIFKEGSYGINANQTAVTATVNNQTITTAKEQGFMHVVLTYDRDAAADQQKLYINGEEKTRATLTQQIGQVNADLLVGEFYNGSIDEVAVHSRALSAQEVLNHYQRGILDIIFKVRSCNDAACNGESFEQILQNASNTLQVTNNSFFQYLAVLSTEDPSFTPKLLNVTISSLDISPPGFRGELPPINESFLIRDQIEIGINATDEAGVDTVSATIVFPNGSQTQGFLTKNGNKYNSSFIIPDSAGQYNITFVANDTSSNVNKTTTFFQANFTAIHTATITDEDDKVVSTETNTTYEITITNTGTTGDNYSIALLNPNNATILLNQSNITNLDAGRSAIIVLSVLFNASLNVSTTVIANSQNDLSFSVNVSQNTEYLDGPVISTVDITPRAILNNSGVEFFIAATGEDGLEVNITFPDGTVDMVMLDNNINTTYADANQLGRYNVTFIATDAAGNIATVTDFFEVFEQISFSVTVIDANNSGIESNIKVLFRNDTIAKNASANGTFNPTLINTIVDMEFRAFNDSVIILLSDINLSKENNKAFKLDKHSDLDFPLTYGVNTTYEFTSAFLRLSYNNSGFGNENILHLFKCSAYNFSQRSCSSGFEDITENSTQDLNNDRFNLTQTSFSAFSMQQVAPPSGVGSTGGGSGAGSSSTSGGPGGAGTCSSSASGPSSSSPSPSPSRRGALFDIGVEFTAERINLGDNLDVAVKLVNFGEDQEPIDVNLSYTITSSDGTVIHEEVEIRNVDTQLEFIKEFKSHLFKEGQYNMKIELFYEGQLEPAVTEGIFTVGGLPDLPEVEEKEIVLFWPLAIIALIILAAYLTWRHYFNPPKGGSSFWQKLDDEKQGAIDLFGNLKQRFFQQRQQVPDQHKHYDKQLEQHEQDLHQYKKKLKIHKQKVSMSHEQSTLAYERAGVRVPDRIKKQINDQDTIKLDRMLEEVERRIHGVKEKRNSLRK